MATLTELRSLFGNDDLRGKVEAAIVVAANSLLGGTSTADQIAWAAKVFQNPRIEAEKALMAILAENSANTVSQIQSASDTAIQNGVNRVVDILVAAYGAS